MPYWRPVGRAVTGLNMRAALEVRNNRLLQGTVSCADTVLGGLLTFFGNHLPGQVGNDSSHKIKDVACVHPFLALCDMTR